MERDEIMLPEPMEQLTGQEWEDLGFTRAQFENRWRARLERDKRSPEVGSGAPDFELELLSHEGNRTNKLFKLSSLVGNPIGLIFGSYT